jgi:hypothetical protein
MKKLDAVRVYDEMAKKQNHITAIQTMVLQQISIVEKLLENHQEYVVSPLSYNACVGLIEQLKLHSFSAFTESTGCEPSLPTGDHAKITIMHGC